MKMRIVMLCLLVFTAIDHADAELKPSALQSKTVLTEQALLLSQLDILSLYFSSPAVSYVPKPVGETRVEIELAVLDPALAADRDRLYLLLSRQISVFTKQLQSRLGLYAPLVAKHFDSKSDLQFIIVEGAKRLPVAIWDQGEWQWAASLAKVGVQLSDDERIYAPRSKGFAAAKPTKLSEREQKWLSCPAMRHDS